MSVMALIDTNVILDVLCAREPFVDDSERVLNLCETNSVDGCLSALSVPNLIYIMRKELNPKSISNVIDTLEMMLTIVDLKAADLKLAAALQWKDFEDALQHVTARRIKADYIITRNTKDFNESSVKVITPSEFLVLIAEEK